MSLSFSGHTEPFILRCLYWKTDDASQNNHMSFSGVHRQTAVGDMPTPTGSNFVSGFRKYAGQFSSWLGSEPLLASAAATVSVAQH